MTLARSGLARRTAGGSVSLLHPSIFQDGIPPKKYELERVQGLSWATTAAAIANFPHNRLCYFMSSCDQRKFSFPRPADLPDTGGIEPLAALAAHAGRSGRRLKRSGVVR